MDNTESRNILIIILLLQLIIYITMFFDVPIARQVIGFIYYTFFPGFIIMNLLNVNEIDEIESLLLSVGFSIAFLMIGGLIINQFCTLLGISNPLSLMPLMIFFNTLILVGAILVYLKGGRSRARESQNNIQLKLSPFFPFLLCLPILSVIGVIWVNAYNNNIILLFMIMVITLLFIIGVISNSLLQLKLYGFAVVSIAIALLYHTSLISNNIITFGSDVTVEYYVCKLVENNAYWSSTGLPLYGLMTQSLNAMLSITILPIIYSVLLNMDVILIFKIIYPLIFSLVPLGLYQIWKRYMIKKFAFISTFLLMGSWTFYNEMLGLNRQMIGELFFVLLLLVILNKEIKFLNKFVCFIIFSFSLVTSHYALAEIFLIFISSTLVILIVLKRPSRNITVSMVLLFSIIMFCWYIYTSNSAVFDSFIHMGNYVYSQLGDFFDLSSRGKAVLEGLGLVKSPSILQAISRTFQYITEALIIIGFIGLFFKRIKTRYDMDYFVLTSVAVLFIAALILVPGLAMTFNMSRFYHLLLFFLAPLCTLGTETLAGIISKKKTRTVTLILILLVFLPYFWFQSNFVYEVTGHESWSVPLSMHRMNEYKLYTMRYIPEQNVFGASWLSKYVDSNSTKIYSDISARSQTLRAYGLIWIDRIDILYNTTKTEANGIIFLGKFNVIYGLVNTGNMIWNSSKSSFPFDDMAKIYSNGCSENLKNIIARAH